MGLYPAAVERIFWPQTLLEVAETCARDESHGCAYAAPGEYCRKGRQARKHRPVDVSICIQRQSVNAHIEGNRIYNRRIPSLQIRILLAQLLLAPQGPW